MKRRLGLAAAGAAIVVAAAVLIVHTPPVRAAVLRYAVSAIQEQYGLRLEATSLDYNLASLHLGLTGVRISAPGELPFAEADHIDADVASRIWSGQVALDHLQVSRLLVRIVRHADGRTNLPVSTAAGSGEPAALPIARLTIPDLRLEVRDDVNGLSVTIPALAVQLAREDGRVALAQPATVRVGDTTTTVTTLAGGAAFDGRDLHLTNLRLEAPEVNARLDGTLALLRAVPGVDAAVTATVNLPQVGRWAVPEEDAPRGRIDVAGQVRGPLAAPEADQRLMADAVTWRFVTVSGVQARASVTADSLTVADARFGVEGGDVAGEATVPLGDGPITAHATWRALPSDRLARLALAPDLLPAGAISGELEARGSGGVDGWTVDLRLRVDQARDRRDRVSWPGETRLHLASGRWQLEGRHRIANVAPVTLRLGGGVRDPITRSTVAGAITLGATSLPAAAATISRLGLAVVPPDLVSGGTVTGQVLVSGTAGAPQLRFTATTTDAATAAGTGPLAVSGIYHGARGSYTLDADAQGWRLQPQADVPVSGTVSARFAGRGRGSRLSGEGDLLVTAAQWDTIGLGDLDAHVTLADRTAQITARAPAFALTADAAVSIDTPYQATLTATTTRLDLAQALTPFALPEPVSGRLTAQLEASGPLAAWRDGRAQLEIAMLDAVAGDLPLRLTSPARARYVNERLTVDRLEAMAGATHLSVSGTLPVFPDAAATPGDAIVGMLTGDLGDALQAVVATRLASVPIAEAAGPVVLLARLTGTLAAPAYAADLELGPASISAADDVPPVTNVRVRAHLDNDRLTLRQAAASYQDAVLTATGSAPLPLLLGEPGSGGEAILEARATGITPATLRPYVDEATLGDLAGQVDASLQITTSSLDLADARGELRLDRFDVAVAGLPIAQRAPTRVRIENGVARIASWDWAGEGASLTLGGQVGLADRRLGLQADGDLDLRLLAPYARPLGLSVAGRMQPHVAITGAIDDPRFNGDVSISGGEARLADHRVVLSDLAARATLAGTTVDVVSLTGLANGGALKATGSLRYGADAGLQARVDAAVSGMALEFPEGLRTGLDAMLTLALADGPGQAPPAGTLSGTVTILEGAYRDPLPVVAGLLASVRASAATTGDGGPSPALDGLVLDIRLVTGDDLVVDNNVARLQMGADLRVIGTAASPALSGRVDIRDGGQLYLGRNVYTVGEPSRIDFSNPTTIEPDLDITATTRAGGEDIQVRISGTPETLAPALSSPSNPSLGQADLAALLLTGRTLEALPGEDAAVIGAEVLGNLSGDVLGFAGRAFGLDVLRLGGVDTQNARRDPAIVATATDPTARLTFGKSLGPNLDVTLSQSLRDADAQTWIVDYLPTRRLALRFLSDDEDLRSYQFRHDVTFGGGPARSTTRTTPTPRVSRETPRVAAVLLRGALAFPEPELRKRLDLTPGERFDFIAWQRDRDRLQDYYLEHRHLAARVAASRQAGDEGVTLVYQIDAGPETAIVVTGTTLDPAVWQRLESAWAGTVFEGFVIDEARTIVEDALAASGYRRAVVRPSMETVDGVRTLAIAVEPGPLVAATPAPATPPAAMRVVGDVTFIRSDALPADAVRAAADLTAGTPVGPMTVDDARQRVQALYRREGFSAARVDAQQAVRAAPQTVDVTFDVDAGPRQVVGAVTIDGNRGIDADVIERALRLEVGQPLRVQDWLDARRRVFDTGLFRRVDLATEPMTGDPTAGDAGVRPMRVRATVEEWPALRLRYGIQASEERPEGEVTGRNLVPGLNADLTRRTLFGRAITTGGALELQRRNRNGRVFLSTPTLAGLPIASSLVVQRSRQEFAAATLVTDLGTIAWEERTTALGRRLNLSSTYRFERNHTFDTAPSPDPLFPSFDVTVNIARLTGAAAWDTRDDAGDTTRGELLSYTLEYGPGSLGSDIRFVRSLGQAYAFRTWRQVVLASAARVGLVRALGGQLLIPSLKFFSGGARSVRGVAEDGLGPRDFFGDPAGGDRLLVLNQEARVPLGNWLRAVGFIDAGHVVDRTRDASPRGLTGSVGAGLRLVTPVALLRVDYGRPVWGPGTEGGSGRWYFGIGQTF